MLNYYSNIHASKTNTQSLKKTPTIFLLLFVATVWHTDKNQVVATQISPVLLSVSYKATL